MDRFDLTHLTHDLGPQPAGPNRIADYLGSASDVSTPDVCDPDASPEESVRWDLIRRLRREIAAGTYATPERWAQACEGLARDAG